nr:hypothetical protein [Arenimonas daejeonensis]
MRLNPSPLALALAAGLLLSACNQGPDLPSNDAPADAVAAASDTTLPADDAAARDAQTDPLDAILAGDWRDPANSARDTWRHPRETLAFFGVGPSQQIVEISPGGGWYTEILAPLAQARAATPASSTTRRRPAANVRSSTTPRTTPSCARSWPHAPTCTATPPWSRSTRRHR